MPFLWVISLGLKLDSTVPEGLKVQILDTEANSWMFYVMFGLKWSKGPKKLTEQETDRH